MEKNLANVANVNETNNKVNEKVENKKVSAKRKVAQAKANKSILDSLFAQLNANNDVKKGNGGLSPDIYKKEIFVKNDGTLMLPEEKKVIRRKLRKMLQNLCLSLQTAKDKNKLAKDFYAFYSSVYSLNDFSVNSVCSGKTDTATRNLYEKSLLEFKKLLKK